MIRFFSKIRMNLLEKSKVTRYLAYAVGEIILVVVGILIALQVNNWNEGRKDRESEIQILKEIHSNLHTDLEEFERNIRTFERQQIACEKLLVIVRNDLPDNRSYGFHISFSAYFPNFTPTISGYQLLQNKGLNLVRNDELRKSITDLYEYVYNFIREQETQIDGFGNSLYEPALAEYHGIDSLTIEDQMDSYDVPPISLGRGRFRPMVRFDQFKRDTRLHSLIKSAQVKGAAYWGRPEDCVLKVKELLVQLEAEFE